MSDVPDARPEDAELCGILKQRLIEEGFPWERAEPLAGALLGSGRQLAEALGEVESKLDRLTDVLDEFAKHASDAAESIENAGNAAASSGEKAAAAARQWREYWEAAADGAKEAKAPAAPIAPDRAAGPALTDAHESRLRHPIHAAAREAHELHDTVVKGESGTTPAILAGAWITFLIPFVAIVVGLALGVAYLVTRGDGSGGIATAPSFSTDELAALPTDNWITNGGSLSNKRYSPLEEIDSSNVSQLKGVWHAHLRGSALAAKYSAESQPLVYKGTIYVPTGEDDVFAVDVATGDILWQYKANLNQKISTVCCGWLSGGVALGDGKVYIGQLGGNLVALDQKTGAVAWKTGVAQKAATRWSRT